MKKKGLIFRSFILVSVLLLVQIYFGGIIEASNGSKNQASNYTNPHAQGPLDAPILNIISPSLDTDGRIELSWNSISGAQYYNIYRNSSTITAINSSLLVGTTTKTSLIDYVKANGTYFYGITAKNRTDGESSLSNIREVSIQIAPDFATTYSLEYSRVVGGYNNEISNSIVVDVIGNSYIVGYTGSESLFVCNAYDDTLAPASYDAFVAKYSPTGAKLWETYLGGSSGDIGTGIALDNESNVIVTGFTYSSDFPTVLASNSILNGTTDNFITKFNSDGEIQWSTLIGGSGNDQIEDIAIDNENNIYITGQINSSDAYIMKLNASGYLLWEKYISGNSDESGYGIALDNQGYGYVVGYTYSSDFLNLNNNFPSSYHGDYDVFVIKFSLSGDIVRSTILGGTKRDIGRDIAIDGSNNYYITGYTQSATYPTKNAFDSVNIEGRDDGFITVFNPDGEILWSTYLGGYNADGCYSIAVDAEANCYVTGTTYSSDFPTKNAIYPNQIGGWDLFLSRFDSSGQLILSSYIGASNRAENGNHIYVDTTGKVFIVGDTTSTNFPIINVEDSVNTDHDIYIYNFNYYYYTDAYILCYPHIELLPTPTINVLPSSVSTTGEISLDWNDIGNASYYILYRSTSNFTKIDSNVVTIISTTSSSAYDEVPNTGEYYYAVAVYDRYGYYNLSACQKVTVTGIMIRAPTLHSILSPVQLYNSVPLTWNNSHRVTSYKIYRSTQPFTSITNADYINTTTSTEFYDKVPTIGTYYYGVTTVYSTYGESVLSNIQAVEVQYENNTLPRVAAISSNLSLSFLGENFTLRWRGIDPNTYQPTFVLLRNQTQIMSGNWTSGRDISILIQADTLGHFLFELRVNDGYNCYATAQVIVVISLAQNDEDGDGMTNGYERMWSLNPFFDDSQEDPDTDQLINIQEFQYNTNPFSNDSDGEGLTDWAEIFTYCTDPNMNDTDLDTFSDMTEVQFFTNPLSYWSNPVANAIYIVLAAGVAFVTFRTGKRYYKKHYPIFKQKYREILSPGYIFNLPEKLRTNKIQLFRLQFEHQLKLEGYQKKVHSQDWFSKSLLDELKTVEDQLEQKNFISVAREMTKIKLEILTNFEIPTKFFTQIKAAVEQEITTLEFSSLDGDLQTIIKGFEISYKQKVPHQSGKNQPNTPNEFQVFLTWRENIIPLQQKLAYNHQIKKEIDQQIGVFKQGEWVIALSSLKSLQSRIQSKNPPYAESVSHFIGQIVTKCTDFLNTAQKDQFDYLHTLEQQKRFDFALYSWLKFTQFKHPQATDPQWQTELTNILKEWKNQMKGLASPEFERIIRDLQWIISAFSAQTEAITKITQFMETLKNSQDKMH